MLDGDDGPARDVVVLNAAAAIVVGGGALDLETGAARGREAIDSGAASAVLARLIELSGELAAS